MNYKAARYFYYENGGRPSIMFADWQSAAYHGEGKRIWCATRPNHRFRIINRNAPDEFGWADVAILSEKVVNSIFKSNRYTEIASRYFPEGYDLFYWSSLSGRHLGNGIERYIKSPYPNNRKRLYVFLHECAHAHLNHGKSITPRHVREYEAHLWVRDVMKKERVPLPRHFVHRIKNHISNYIAKEKADGIEIDPVVYRYVR